MSNSGEAAPAKKLSAPVRGFLIHLAAYVVVNAGLVGLNLTRSPDHLWFQWPLMGWGLGIVAHGAAVCLGRRK